VTTTHHDKNIKPEVVDVILEWEQMKGKKHIKFERKICAENGAMKRQVLSCSTSPSDYQWARVVSRDFLKRQSEKESFLAENGLAEGSEVGPVADV
jgi:hypothetical protein